MDLDLDEMIQNFNGDFCIALFSLSTPEMLHLFIFRLIYFLIYFFNVLYNNNFVIYDNLI